MRIAQVSLQFEATATGGGGVHVQRVTQHLVEMGHRVTVLSIHTAKTLGSARLEEGLRPYSLEDRGPLQVVRFLVDPDIAQPYEGDKGTEIRRIREFCEAAAWWLLQRPRDFDVVHLHGHHLIPGYLAWRLRGGGFKVVSTVHFLESTLVETRREGVSHFDVPERALAQMRRWEAMSRYADAVVVISPGMREELFEIARGLGLDPAAFKVRVIPSGAVNEGSLLSPAGVRRKLARLPNPVEMVTFCRLDPSKGVEFAIRGAALAARRSARSLRLTVAGIPSGSYLDLLREEAERASEALPVDIRTFEAIFTDRERNEFLDGFCLYLFPTLSEPFGMTLIEAAARGLIAVATDAAGPRYILGGERALETPWGYITDYGLCARREPLEQLAHNLGQALAWALNHWKESVARALALRDRVEREFTWRRVAQRYLELYEGD